MCFVCLTPREFAYFKWKLLFQNMLDWDNKKMECYMKAGEEMFAVRWEEDDSVWYEVLSFSKPAKLLSRITYPYVQWRQRHFAKQSSNAMLTAVSELGYIWSESFNFSAVYNVLVCGCTLYRDPKTIPMQSKTSPSCSGLIRLLSILKIRQKYTVLNLILKAEIDPRGVYCFIDNERGNSNKCLQYLLILNVWLRYCDKSEF